MKTGAVGNYETRLPSQITWLGLSGVYTEDERQLMSALPVREQTILHVLKSLTDGEVSPGAASGFPEKESTTSPGQGIAVYTKPEDLDFGAPKRRKKSLSRRKRLYELAATGAPPCQARTKGEGDFWMKVWKAWYERQGWKVVSHSAGYFARKESLRAAIILREWDAETLERL